MTPELHRAIERIRDIELRAATVMEAVDCLYRTSEKLVEAAKRTGDWYGFKRDICPACRSAQGLLSSIRDLVRYMEVECAEVKQLCELTLPCAQEKAA